MSWQDSGPGPVAIVGIETRLGNGRVSVGMRRVRQYGHVEREEGSAGVGVGEIFGEHVFQEVGREWAEERKQGRCVAGLHRTDG